jgi:hypothetical protein
MRKVLFLAAAMLAVPALGFAGCDEEAENGDADTDSVMDTEAEPNTELPPDPENNDDPVKDHKFDHLAQQSAGF